jgi:hypothetical protein
MSSAVVAFGAPAMGAARFATHKSESRGGSMSSRVVVRASCGASRGFAAAAAVPASLPAAANATLQQRFGGGGSSSRRRPTTRAAAAAAASSADDDVPASDSSADDVDVAKFATQTAGDGGSVTYAFEDSVWTRSSSRNATTSTTRASATSATSTSTSTATTTSGKLLTPGCQIGFLLAKVLAKATKSILVTGCHQLVFWLSLRLSGGFRLVTWTTISYYTGCHQLVS